MLLKALVEWALTSEDLTPPMYQEIPIRWLMELTPNGTFKDWERTSGTEGKKNDVGKRYAAPHVMRTSTAIRPKLLADNCAYVLGVDRQKKAEKPSECHTEFTKLVRDCAESTGEPTVRAVADFLEKNPKPALREDFNLADNISFRVGEVLPFTLPSVKLYWATKAPVKEGRPLQCIVCGNVRPAQTRLTYKIKMAGAGSGAAIISAEGKAFESYGLSNSLIAPTCGPCGEAFSKALNQLLSDEQHHLRIGPATHVFWSKDDSFSPYSFLSHPDSGEVKALLQSAFTAKRSATLIESTPFYSVALKATKGRVAVRDWVDTTVENAKANLARYFALQRITDHDGGDWAPCNVFALAAATVRDAKDLPAHTVDALLHFIFHSGVLPMWLLYEAVRRNRAEQAVTRSRAALIKLVLLSQDPNAEGGEEMVELDAGQRHPAYLCGRLLSVLDKLQRQAIGQKIDSSVAERFYGAASATPNVVFPTLMRKAEVHFAKLRSQEDAAGYAIRMEVEDILAGLQQEFPSVLTLKDQGLFALGYYHQRAYDRAQMQKRKEAKQAKEAAKPAAATE